MCWRKSTCIEYVWRFEQVDENKIVYTELQETHSFPKASTGPDEFNVDVIESNSTFLADEIHKQWTRAMC